MVREGSHIERTKDCLAKHICRFLFRPLAKASFSPSVKRFLDYLISHRSKQKIERKKPFLQNDSEDHTIVNEQWVDYILVTIAEFWNKRLKWKAVVRLLDSDNWTEVAGAYSLMVHECSASTLKNNCKVSSFP